jgi:hypothetical protein
VVVVWPEGALETVLMARSTSRTATDEKRRNLLPVLVAVAFVVVCTIALAESQGLLVRFAATNSAPAKRTYASADSTASAETRLASAPATGSGHGSSADTTASATAAGIDHIFVVHYKPNKDRKIALQALLAPIGVQATWLEDDDAEELSNSTIARHYDHFRYLLDASPDNSFVGRMMSRPELSLAVKHLKALELAVERGYSRSLILEDDAVFLPPAGQTFPNPEAAAQHFMAELHQSLAQLEALEGEGKPWDVLCLSNLRGSCQTNIKECRERAPGALVYKKFHTRGQLASMGPDQIFRSADSFVITLEGARRLHRWGGGRTVRSCGHCVAHAWMRRTPDRNARAGVACAVSASAAPARPRPPSTHSLLPPPLSATTLPPSLPPSRLNSRRPFFPAGTPSRSPSPSTSSITTP